MTKKNETKNKEMTREEIAEILKENKRLKSENASMQKVLNSKRFRMAEKVANVYNAMFPEGTVRRKTLNASLTPVRKVSEYKARADVRKVEKLIPKGKKVIVLHSIPWNTPLRQRPHHLAKCLAAQDDVTVIYFEPDEQLKGLRVISENFLTTNSWKVILELKHSAANKYYFFFNNVSNIPLKTIKEVKKSGYELVYEYIDEFHEDISGSLVNQLEVWNALPKIGPFMVLASANKLYDEAVEHFGKMKVVLSKNAVNVEDFDFHNFTGKEVPSDLAKVLKNGKPVVGYYGALAPWLNYDLIAEAAEKRPKYNFVLIGVNYQDALKNLDLSIKNIYYLGPKNYNELPEYSRKFDCAIIPFKTGEIAKGTSPVKLFEYMAMGLPTVGTRDLNECKGFEYVYLAKNSDEFVEMLDKAISEHADEKVRSALLSQAEENSWEIRAKEIATKL